MEEATTSNLVATFHKMADADGVGASTAHRPQVSRAPHKLDLHVGVTLQVDRGASACARAPTVTDSNDSIYNKQQQQPFCTIVF